MPLTKSTDNEIDEMYLAELAAEEQDNPTKTSQVTLERVSKACKDAADLELDIFDLEERLREKKQQLRSLTSETIPALMEQAGLRDLTIHSKNPNLPDKKISLKTFCYANIAASWDRKRREEAFEALRKCGDGAELIKHEVKFKFGRGEDSYLQQLLQVASKMKLDADVKESVHQQTLSKWLRERRKKGLPHPPLDLIGGVVGQEAVIEDAS